MTKGENKFTLALHKMLAFVRSRQSAAAECRMASRLAGALADKKMAASAEAEPPPELNFQKVVEVAVKSKC